jgi:hypothetical protein
LISSKPRVKVLRRDVERRAELFALPLERHGNFRGRRRPSRGQLQAQRARAFARRVATQRHAHLLGASVGEDERLLFDAQRDLGHDRDGAVERAAHRVDPAVEHGNVEVDVVAGFARHD